MSKPAIFDAFPAAADTPVVITLFGNLQIRLNGKAVDPFRLNKSRALLAYLLIEGAQPLLRTELATLLWPGYTAASALTSLRQTLDDLRKLLKPFGLLRATRHHVELRRDPALLWCDLHHFQALLRSQETHEHHTLADCAHCHLVRQEAVTVGQGILLDQLSDVNSPPFDAWLQAQRQHFAEQRTTAQAALALALTRAPCRLSNLSPPLTPLIGRATELAELVRKVQHPTYRCLTLTGPGGVGKTRLAQALGAQVQKHFPDGVWLVELAAVNQPPPHTVSNPPLSAEQVTAEWLHDRIATTIGDAVGLKFHANAHPSVEVATYLRNKETLLILDNVEHLVDGVDWLLTLLATAPRLRLVITSRHRLPIQAQLVYEVAGLSVPPAPTAELSPTLTAPAVFTHYASVQLFLERATAAQIPLPLDAATLAIIAQLCQLVAGHPLAIELAVALLEQQSPTELLQAIQNDYRVLSSVWRDLPPRQRSAEAVLRSAWRLLTPDEATLLARCAVFRGGFTAAAVQAIGDAPAAVLQALRHKSLIHPVGVDRFTLHELVRQFATEQLAQTPTLQAVQAHHAAYYMALAQAEERALLCDFAAQEAIHAELDNLRTAWQWCATQGEPALLIKGAPSLFTFYRLTGLYHEALQALESAILGLRRLINRVVADPAEPLTQWLLARLLVVAADFYRRTGALATSTEAATEALTLGRQLAAQALQGAALHELARLAQVRGDFHAMQNLAEAGCTQARLAGKGGPLVDCLNAVGWALYSQQQPLAAIPYFQAALDELTDAPNVHLEGRIRANLGQSYLATRAYVLAQHHFAAALVVQERLRDQEEILLTRFMLGELWTAVGDYDAAQAEFTQATKLIQLTANPYWRCWLYLRYGRWQQRHGDFTGAQMSLTLARQTAQQSENRAFEHAALLELGALFVAQEQWAAAQQCYEQSLTRQTDSSHRADAQAGLALCALAAGQSAAAVSYVESALELLARHGDVAARDLFQLYWFCLRVLHATADPRAHDLLRSAYQLLHQDAAQFEDDAQRRRFLAEVPAQRAIVEYAQSAGLPKIPES